MYRKRKKKINNRKAQICVGYKCFPLVDLFSTEIPYQIHTRIRIDRRCELVSLLIVYSFISIKPSKMEVAPQGCLQITNKKTTNQINWVRFAYKG